MVDAISPADDEPTYLQVLTGRREGQPDWLCVEITEELRVKILAYTPTGDRKTPRNAWFQVLFSALQRMCAKVQTP
jgi:hypothetical protein